MPAAAPVSRETLIAEAEDHCWIEYRPKGGNWTALDPSFPQPHTNASFAQATETWPTIPGSLFHKVAIKIKVEERQGGTLTSREILNHQATAADLNGAAVNLTWRYSGSEDEWSATPVLQIDGESIGGQPLIGHPGPTNLAQGIARGMSGLGPVCSATGLGARQALRHLKN